MKFAEGKPSLVAMRAFTSLHLLNYRNPSSLTVTSSSSLQFPLLSKLYELCPDHSLLHHVSSPTISDGSPACSPLDPFMLKGTSKLIGIAINGILLESFVSWRSDDPRPCHQLWVTLQSLYASCLNSHDLDLQKIALQSLYPHPTIYSNYLTGDIRVFCYPSEFIVSLLQHTGDSSQSSIDLSITSPVLSLLYILYCFSYPLKMIRSDHSTPSYSRFSEKEYRLFIASYLQHLAPSINCNSQSFPLNVNLVKDFDKCSSWEISHLTEFKQLCEVLGMLLTRSDRPSSSLDESLCYFYLFLIDHQRVLQLNHLKEQVFSFSLVIEDIMESRSGQEKQVHLLPFLIFILILIAGFAFPRDCQIHLPGDPS